MRFEREDPVKKISLIAAVDENRGIGYGNQLLFHLRKDMEFFRKKTLGNIVVMGRKTWESLPDRKPLPERINVVLTRQNAEALKEISREQDLALLIAASREELEEQISSLNGEVFVIGGGEIYREFLPIASDVYLTRVECRKPADTHFPDWEQCGEWDVVSISEPFEEEGMRFRFCHYRRRSSGLD